MPKSPCVDTRQHTQSHLPWTQVDYFGMRCYFSCVQMSNNKNFEKFYLYTFHSHLTWMQGDFWGASCGCKVTLHLSHLAWM